MSNSRCAEAQPCFPSPHHPHRALREAGLSPEPKSSLGAEPNTSGTGLQGLTGSMWGSGERDQEQRGRQGCTSEQCKYNPAHAGAGKGLEIMEIISFNPALCVCVELFPPSLEGWSSLRGQGQGREEQPRLPRMLWLPPLKAALCAALPCCL